MSVSAYDENLFTIACDKIIDKERNFKGIGTLKEKTMHAVFKNFYEPDENHQEIKVGRFVADILREDEIIEVQTRSFNAIRKKLDVFLEQYPVTIVYPIVHTKWIIWIDEQTGEITNKRKSPKSGSFYDAFFELYKIKPYLTNKNLHICLTLVDAEEYRLLNGWNSTKKRGSTRYDRIPTKLVDELYIGGSDDYLCLIPDSLPEQFTARDYALAAKINIRYAQTAMNIFSHIGCIKKIGKSGRSYLYTAAKKAMPAH